MTGRKPRREEEAQRRQEEEDQLVLDVGPASAPESTAESRPEPFRDVYHLDPEPEPEPEQIPDVHQWDPAEWWVDPEPEPEPVPEVHQREQSGPELFYDTPIFVHPLPDEPTIAPPLPGDRGQVPPTPVELSDTREEPLWTRFASPWHEIFWKAAKPPPLPGDRGQVLPTPVELSDTLGVLAPEPVPVPLADVPPLPGGRNQDPLTKVQPPTSLPAATPSEAKVHRGINEWEAIGTVYINNVEVSVQGLIDEYRLKNITPRAGVDRATARERADEYVNRRVADYLNREEARGGLSLEPRKVQPRKLTREDLGEAFLLDGELQSTEEILDYYAKDDRSPFGFLKPFSHLWAGDSEAETIERIQKVYDAGRAALLEERDGQLVLAEGQQAYTFSPPLHEGLSVQELIVPTYDLFKDEFSDVGETSLGSSLRSKSERSDDLWTAGFALVDVLPVPTKPVTSVAKGVGRVALPANLGGGFVSAATPWPAVPKIPGSPYSQEVLDASLKARKELAQTGQTRVTVGGKTYTLKGDRLDEALRRANPDTTITYTAAPDVEKFMEGGIVPVLRYLSGEAKEEAEQGVFLSVAGPVGKFMKRSAFGHRGTSPGVVAYDYPLEQLGVPGSPSTPLGVNYYGGRELEEWLATGGLAPPVRSVAGVGEDWGGKLYMPSSMKAPSYAQRLRANVLATGDVLRYLGKPYRRMDNIRPADAEEIARSAYGKNIADLTPSEARYVELAQLDDSSLRRSVSSGDSLEDAVLAQRILDERGAFEATTTLSSDGSRRITRDTNLTPSLNLPLISPRSLTTPPGQGPGPDRLLLEQPEGARLRASEEARLKEEAARKREERVDRPWDQEVDIFPAGGRVREEARSVAGSSDRLLLEQLDDGPRVRSKEEARKRDEGAARKRDSVAGSSDRLLLEQLDDGPRVRSKEAARKRDEEAARKRDSVAGSSDRLLLEQLDDGPRVRSKEAARKRDEEAARKRDEEAARKRDEEAARKRDEEAARKRDEEAARKRDEEAARKRDEEAARKRDEEAARKRDEEGARESKGRSEPQEVIVTGGARESRGRSEPQEVIVTGGARESRGRSEPQEVIVTGGARESRGRSEPQEVIVTGGARESRGRSEPQEVIVTGGARESRGRSEPILGTPPKRRRRRLPVPLPSLDTTQKTAPPGQYPAKVQWVGRTLYTLDTAGPTAGDLESVPLTDEHTKTFRVVEYTGAVPPEGRHTAANLEVDVQGKRVTAKAVSHRRRRASQSRRVAPPKVTYKKGGR